MKAKAKAALLLVPVLLAGVLLPASAGKAAGRFNLSYLFSGTPETFVRDVDQTKGSLQTVAPAYLELTQEGTVQAARDMGSSFIRDMHDRGIRVVPYLNNEWNRTLAVKTVNNRAQVTDQLAELVKAYNLDGIQLDLENLPASSREAYTDMVRLLRGKLPAGKEVSVAVGANPTGTSSGWLGAFDYKALAPYCDYLLIMAYEEHFEETLSRDRFRDCPLRNRRCNSPCPSFLPRKSFSALPSTAGSGRTMVLCWASGSRTVWWTR
ncbi:glycosyl hydrolase family 18 protein [Paenibacillus sp. CC-CFT747]|nr:glycosyl hydrolase family 18 protein [Paenibacillus sp. CC-CFT747]